MFNVNTIVAKAKDSSFYRGLLNWSLARMIPFNKPHGFRIVALHQDHLKVLLPYRKRNFNHIRGLHACALATVSEFATGFLLVTRLDGKKYRLIMQRLEMDYHYQGKMDAFATFSITDAWLQEQVYKPLKDHDAVVVKCEVKVHDAAGSHLTTGIVFWQIKAWQNVRTKLPV
ncbi:MAG TPA: DUF4442 domain-containing protein [Ohtaekwangia sp.]|nr:DUF4442 domain-containing protein [Ohtaekwangia sp.]